MVISFHVLISHQFCFCFTGDVRTAASLDREAVPHYWLTVYAKDLGTVPLLSWTEVYIEVLDINDNPPELSLPVYFSLVQENLPKDKYVLQVSATDMDKSSEGKLTFQILDSQRSNFSIDAKTGKHVKYVVDGDSAHLIIQLSKHV